ncbi:RNA polymerase recycling motor ATPase HelR [Microbacterium luticocti]|uniref:RNA polymerase recycling motor ATPase HelR n=1 Tax=Microbacterium luticocti TaxID=451764 RepID=UPI0004013F03|nr:RNA polymerase recycling motor ATPase HelR [Microbacterium luticocti]
MPATSVDVFALPARLSARADPALIDGDRRRFAAIAARLGDEITEVQRRLADRLAAPAGRGGQYAIERDAEVRRLQSRLRLLRRFHLDICLGRMDPDAAGPVYIGRIGLADASGDRLLVDWRAPAAAPFFAATAADPMGLVSRRRYRWTAGRITDYWDEVFDPDTAASLGRTAAFDDQSAFIASLGSSRTERMRDVLATIQSDQDAIIRADSRGALVVDGGPGTGKTVVALHRAAYLLYSDARLSGSGGGVLFVGPHQPYLAYVSDVLPSLGEDGVQLCTLTDLVREGADAVPETDPKVAALKADARWVEAVERAVRFYEEPPTAALKVDTPWGELSVSVQDWADAFDAPEPGLSHNDARDQVWQTLVAGLYDRLGDPEVPGRQFLQALRQCEPLAAAFQRGWPLVEASVVVTDLFTVPAFLRRCAPWLTAEEAALLQRPADAPFTLDDLPLLDAARLRLGDPRASRVRRRREAELAAQRAYRDDVAEYLISSADDGEDLVSMLRGGDLQTSLEDESGLARLDPDLLAGPFAHIVVDEAQELTDAQWQMLLRRCPSRSFTVVGDRAQARRGFAETWTARLQRVGLREVRQMSLTVNYRTPHEVMDAAAPVIRAVLPDANVPTSVRSTGIPVRHATASERDAILAEWLDTHAEGIACVVGGSGFADAEGVGFAGSDRVRSLSPEHVKGLEFDLVLIHEPGAFGEGVTGAVDRYVAMTRATGQLIVLTD